MLKDLIEYKYKVIKLTFDWKIKLNDKQFDQYNNTFVHEFIVNYLNFAGADGWQLAQPIDQNIITHIYDLRKQYNLDHLDKYYNNIDIVFIIQKDINK